MFKKSRWKIVVAIMSVLTLLFLGTLSVIYVSSYLEIRYDNLQMLKRQSYMYNRHPTEEAPIQPEASGKNPFVGLATFYSVAISDNGQILATDTGNHWLYNEATLQSYARTILSGGSRSGTKGSLLYLVTPKKGYTLVMFMDDTIGLERMTMLVRNTLIFGGAAMVGLFFLAMYLAKRIVQPLEESYQKQRQFISDAGHELKTPVAVVNTNAEMLRREVGENRWLANIQYENERMGLLVRQLLELARAENVAAVKENLDLSRLVDGEALPFESVAFEKGIYLSTDIRPGVMCYGDAARLRQLVSILIDNAIEHSARGREVAVHLRQEHGWAKLAVVNDGAPIPKERREHLFERFYRVDEARSDDGHYGLGLAIAKAVTDAHKGKIVVECDDGKVTFTVRLPLKKQEKSTGQAGG